MAAATHAISTEEYLRMSYEHDPELIDGQVKERPMPTQLHAFTQALLCHWFVSHMEEWGIMAMPELRTKVKPARFRLPDVVVTPIHPLDHSPLSDPPVIAIEILSESDSFSDLRDRAADLTTMGTKHVWLIDPEQRTAYTWKQEAWIPTEQLTVPETPIYLDLVWLRSKLLAAQG